MRRIVFSVLCLFAASLVFGAELKYNFKVPFCFDRLVNTSRLSDSELRTLFESLDEAYAAKLLDLDSDGIADFTAIEVCEFIERMKIILSDRRPFNYTRDVINNPIGNHDPRLPVISTTDV